MDNLKDLFRFVDDRGTLDMIFNSDLPFEIKRVYTTVNQLGVIRGMHGHKIEWKAFYVSSGSVKIVIAPMEDPKPESSNSFVLSETKPQLFILPPGFYHGYVSLTPESRIIIFSSATLDETKKDDHRLDPQEFTKCFEVKGR